MSYEIKYPFALASIFIWVGFVGAISFMEAWLKFRAPGISLPLGLGIGRLVFNALNKVEWVLAFIVILNLIIADAEIFTLKSVAYFIPVIILLLQSFWLLPKLDARAELYITGQNVPESNVHLFYIIFEIVKVVCLFIYAVMLFRINN
ncbi:hypothetical protein ABRY23_00315 [Melioribacteraceae bacterium 4301-Me]|uniref:hypothetical protein n=1 Tax=Pyranulibacter aquaticus TaxID=3163344 RepID=UPI0035965049